MLTQKIAKTIFYIHYTSHKDFTELEIATQQFIDGLNVLKNGDSHKEIPAVKTKQIDAQLLTVDNLWNNFYIDVINFKVNTTSQAEESMQETKKLVNSINYKNTILLENVDKLVTLYAGYSENKSEYIKSFQYGSALIFIILFIYSLQ